MFYWNDEVESVCLGRKSLLELENCHSVYTFMMFSVYILPFHVFVTSKKGIIPIFFNISPPTKKSAIRRLRFSKQKGILTIKGVKHFDVLTITLIYTGSRFKCYKKNEVFFMY